MISEIKHHLRTKKVQTYFNCCDDKVFAGHNLISETENHWPPFYDYFLIRVSSFSSFKFQPLEAVISGIRSKFLEKSLRFGLLVSNWWIITKKYPQFSGEWNFFSLVFQFKFTLSSNFSIKIINVPPDFVQGIV